MRVFPDIKNMKMHKKLLISYFIIVIIPILIIGCFLIINTKNIILNYINHINEITLKQIKTNISNEFKKYFKISDDILTETNFIEMLTKEYKNESDYLNFYADTILMSTRRLLLAMPESVRISFFTTNDTIVQDNNMIFHVNRDIIKQNWYRNAIQAKGANVISLPYTNNLGKTVFSISRLLYSSANNKKVIVSRIEVPLQQIDNLMAEEGKNKQVYLLNSNKQIFTLTADDGSDGVHEVGDLFSSRDFESKKRYSMFDEKVCIMLYEQLNIGRALEDWELVLIVSPDLIMKDINKTVIYSVIICLLVMGVTIVFIFIFSYKLTGRLRVLTDSMRRVTKEDSFDIFESYDEDDEIGELSRSFKQMLQRIDKLITEVYISEIRLRDLELEKRQAEIKALQSQINPHFLFNTMESISMSLLTKGDFDTCEVVRSFSNILRKSIEWGDDLSTIKNELDLVLDYLKVQKFRYKDKLIYEINIDETFYDVLIPKFTLQPIVENAMYHGLELKEGQGFLKIYTRPNKSDLKIIVEDNGLGIEAALLEDIQLSIKNVQDSIVNPEEHQSIGLTNINKRLVMYYGEEYGLTIDSLENLGTRVIVKIPIKFDEGEFVDV